MVKDHIGQINLEFLAAAGFYLIALGAVLTASSDVLPHYSQEADKAALNLEARSITNQILTEPGYHSYSSGGTDWEENSNTVNNVYSFGLAGDFLVLERDKIEALSTVSTSSNHFNYSQFKDVTGAKNQYRFNFIWLPTVHTNRSFTRGFPPSNPSITEPSGSSYLDADNEVHYGEIVLEGQSYKFLVLAYNGVYNTTYVSTDWNFNNNVERAVHEPLADNIPFTIHTLQNRDRDPGSLLVLNQTIKTFGANVDSNSIVVAFDRFTVFEGEPLKIEVQTW